MANSVTSKYLFLVPLFENLLTAKLHRGFRFSVSQRTRNKDSKWAKLTPPVLCYDILLLPISANSQRLPR